MKRLRRVLYIVSWLVAIVSLLIGFCAAAQSDSYIMGITDVDPVNFKVLATISACGMVVGLLGILSTKEN